MRFLSFVFVLFMAAGLGFADAPMTRMDPDFEGREIFEVTRDGSDGCPPDVFITPLPYSDLGNTCSATNTVTNYTGGSCGADLPFPYGGEDMIYEITLGAGNSVGFSADLTGSTGDLVLFLLSTCGDGATCLAHSQDSIGPGAGPEVIDPVAYTAGTYYLYVDSYYDAGTNGSCGIYALDVTGTLPAELVSFSVE